MPGEGLRFYGVVDVDDTDPGELEVEGVTLVTFRDLGAVVAPAPYVRISPGDAELADYVRVVDALSARGPVVPAPPGTVFRNAAVIHQWLELHYATLHDALDQIARRDSPNPPYDYVRMELGG